MQVLVWSGATVDDFIGGLGGQTWYAVFDSATDTVGPVSQQTIMHDMFCPGIAMLPNGNPFVVAGSAGGDGGQSSSIWGGSSFSKSGNVKIKRGYNTALTLANGEVRSQLQQFHTTHSRRVCSMAQWQLAARYGRANTCMHVQVFTLGGSFSGVAGEDKGGEVWSGGTWRQTTNILAQSILSDDPQGVFRTDNYPFLFAWTENSGALPHQSHLTFSSDICDGGMTASTCLGVRNGVPPAAVFHAGPSTQMNWFTNLNGAGTTTPAGTRGPTAMNGNFVMYAAGKILTVGGAPSFSLVRPPVPASVLHAAARNACGGPSWVLASPLQRVLEATCAWFCRTPLQCVQQDMHC
ncbi:MAG: hypothetical protein HC767_12540 [Akkermansiaceae bacterium]|nr:hypothetical protein [Akkermansiaceae bacterium]